MMNTVPPKIDKRSFKETLKEFKSLIPFYAPEWKPSEKDAGLALLKIFTHMLETIIERLNRSPQKHFIEFLNTIGVKRLPAQPATTPITFLLSEGTKAHILIPARTQIAAGEVSFETEKNILATPAGLVEAYSINVAEDGIYKSPTHIISGKPVTPFRATLLYGAEKGDREIFISDSGGISKEDNLIIDKTEYAVISQLSDNKVFLAHKLKSRHNAGSTVEKIASFELFEGKNLQEHALYLGHKDVFNVKNKVDIELTISEWNRNLRDNKIVDWQYWGERITVQNNEKRKTLDWYDFETVGSDKRNKKIILTKDNTDEIKKREINGISSRWIRCRAKDIAETKGIPLDIIQIGIVSGVAWVSEFFTLPPIAIRGVGKEFGERLSAEGIKTVGELLLFKDRISELAKKISKKKEEEPSEYYREKAENILENAQKRILDEAYENMEISGIVDKGLLPDMAFYNDVPLDLTTVDGQFDTPIYPFGKIPRLLDTFYIAGQDAFSKKGANITLQFMGYMDSGGDPTPDPSLSWEYWDGKGWVQIPEIYEKLIFDTSQSSSTIFVPIKNFPEVKPTKVNGQENFWIRVRFIGGHYGQEVKISGNTVTQGKVTPPIITFLSINYDYKNNFQNIQHLLTYNNLEFTDLTEQSKTEKKVVKPFLPLDVDHQSLYLGFDKKIEKGPISLFFSMEEQAWAVEKIPFIDWEYFTESGEWVRLDVLDETGGFLRTGAIEFIFPQDFKKSRKFGHDLYWVRAVDVKDTFRSMNKVYAELSSKFKDLTTAGKLTLNKRIIENYLIPGMKIHKPQYLSEWECLFTSFQKPIKSSLITTRVTPPNEREKTTGNGSADKIKPCPNLLETFQPGWGHPDEIKKETISPRIKNIYLNTTWAVQTETIKDEILGSSDGSASQTYTFISAPLISEEIRVNEINTISEEERMAILQEDQAVEVKDEKGKLTGFWVKWMPVEDILASSIDDRHYEIDRASGQVKFGDGIFGKIPSIGTDNIKADYRSGGGKKGNVGTNEIKDLKTSIAFVDKASNPIAAGGGSEVEPLEDVVERGPHILKHRNRAVTALDFEQITYKASRSVARAKCIPNFDNKGEYKPGWVTVVVIPQITEDRPMLSLQLKRNIENHLKLHAPLSMVANNHLQVSEPVYVETSVNTILTSACIDAIPSIEKQAFSTLKDFLHPLTGGTAGKGWEFGRMPCLSDLFAFLEKIDDVDHVKDLFVKLRTYDRDQIISEFTMTRERAVDVEMPPYAIIYSGVHSITVQYEKTNGG
jgi:hypothetical protein